MIIDFESTGVHPLFKKFHMFNSGLAPITRYEENIDAMKRLQPESIRIDMFMGDRNQEFGNIVDGTEDEPIYNFDRLDRLARLFIQYGIRPYWSWCYTPLPLQKKGYDFRSIPTSNEKYAGILQDLVAHEKEALIPVAFHEVYNEPDCHGNLFSGNMYDYLPMYDEGSRGIQKGDEDAVIGGPAEAFAEEQEGVIKSLHAFCQMVAERHLPLHFFSYHTYGYKKNEYLDRTKIMRDLLISYGFTHTELHMNELNILPPLWEYGTTDLTNETLIPKVWDCISELLKIHDLTVVHWAQMINSGVDELSLVSLNGIYYPLFYIFEIYARMPIHPCEIPENEDIGILASNDYNRSSIVIWNKKGKYQSGSLILKGIQACEVRIYRFSSSFYKKCKQIKHMALPCPDFVTVHDHELRIDYQLDAFDMIYCESGDAFVNSAVVPWYWGRKVYSFPNRYTSSYAEIDMHTQTVFLGCGEDADSDPVISLELTQTPKKIVFNKTGMGCSIMLEAGKHRNFHKVLLPNGESTIRLTSYNYTLSIEQCSILPDEKIRLNFCLLEKGLKKWSEIQLKVM